MVKLMFCLRRRQDFSRETFQTYWREQHAPLVRMLAPVLRITKYVQSHRFDDVRVAPVLDARGANVDSYDGVAEICWDSIEDVLAAGKGEDARDAGRRLLEDERIFIDLANSPMFWVEEHGVV